MTTRVPFRRLLAAACAVLDAVVVVVAFVSAGAAPERAHDAFGALIVAQGSMSHSATYPDTFRQFSALARLVQSLLVGGTGIVLIFIGTAAVLRSDPA